MKILIVGATGATGRLLVEELLSREQHVRAVVRSPEKLPEHIQSHKNLTIVKATVLDLNKEELNKLLEGCDAVASCLGHNLNLKGIYGKPRRLVTDTSRRLCEAIKANSPKMPTRFVLMNTTGNRNRDLEESVSFGQKLIFGLIRLLLPPQVDNEKAADYLRTSVGQNNPAIEWVAVRPDNLINEDQASVFQVHPSPTRSAIFNPGKTSRINVARFMSDLITDGNTWNKWQGQMPVIYNISPSE